MSYPYSRSPLLCRGVHYCVAAATHSDSKATSVAHYQRKSYSRERVSGRGLALTWLKGWWLPLHLIHPTKSPSYIYVKKTPEPPLLPWPFEQLPWLSSALPLALGPAVLLWPSLSQYDRVFCIDPQPSLGHSSDRPQHSFLPSPSRSILWWALSSSAQQLPRPCWSQHRGWPQP